jgi:hypothetical protein
VMMYTISDLSFGFGLGMLREKTGAGALPFFLQVWLWRRTAGRHDLVLMHQSFLPFLALLLQIFLRLRGDEFIELSDFVLVKHGGIFLDTVDVIL